MVSKLDINLGLFHALLDNLDLYAFVSSYDRK